VRYATYTHRAVSSLFALCVLLTLLLALGHPAFAQVTRIIFLHHSCGQNLIEQGGVRPGLTALGYEFFDHGYNEEGLRLADGSYTGTNFAVPDDNTDPDGFAAIFAQLLHDPPDNTFSHLMQYDVVAFKSCFPTSNVGDDAQLAAYQSYYRSIRDRMDQYPDKLFIIVTQPPQVPANSDPEEATRARAFANWLQSGEYLSGHPNVFVFDFFGLLAGADNFLRPEYRLDEYDAHPNERANREIGPRFVSFVDQAIRSAGAGQPRPTPPPLTATPSTEPPAQPTPRPTLGPPTAFPPTLTPSPTGEPSVPAPSGLIEGFESLDDVWDAGTDGSGTAVECGPDAGMAHDGAAALRFHHDVVPDGWVDCGHALEPPEDWSAGVGLGLWMRSEGAGKLFTLMLFSGDPGAPTPFEVQFETTAESAQDWTRFVFSWTDFVRAEWAEEGGLSELDPARVTGYAFSLGAGADPAEGTLWVDDVALVTEVEEPTSVPTATPEAVPSSTPVAATSAPKDTPTATPAATVAQEPGTGDRRSICPGAAVALPLAGLGILLAGRQRGKGSTG
jgi:hypothetical protein